MEISTDKSSGSINVVYSFSEKEVNLYSKVTENINKEASCILLEKNEENEKLFDFVQSVFHSSIPRDEICKFIMGIDTVRDLFLKENDFDSTISTMDLLNCFIYTPLSIGTSEGNLFKEEKSIYLWRDKDSEWLIDNILDIIPCEFKENFISSFFITKLSGGNHPFGSRLYYSFINIEKRMNIPQKKTYTYVMTDDTGMYKIGKSISPMLREQSLAVGNHTLRLCFYIEGNHEKELHDKFATKHMKGEWYHLNKSDLKYIRNYNKIKK
jgi:hypothetical protein